MMLHRKRLRIFLLASALLGIAVAASPVVHAATLVVINNDGAGEGFNDPTAAAPVGGNSGTTVGQQRLIAFQAAADKWGTLLSSSVTIRVQAQFNPLTCTATSAVLGSAGPILVFRDFSGAPVAGTWYAVALANALHGSDLDAATNDISAQFNSNIGTAGCLTSSGWYYGLDGATPANRIDFYTVLLHELGHGLGFLTVVNLASGAKLNGFNDAYMRFLENHGASPSDYPSMSDAQRVAASIATGNLHWTGANVRAASGVLTAGKVGDHVQMFAPNPQQAGSSVSHFDTALTPNQLMEPSYTAPLHDPVLELPLFQDIGWTRLTPPSSLQVAPATNIAASGAQGGPFSPSSFQYQLSSSSGSVNFSISGTPSWLTASFISGTATTSPLTVTFTVNSSANSLASGTYGPTTISFTNTSNGQGNTTRTAALTVTAAPAVCGAVAGLPAFSPDGRKDIAWQRNSGEIGVWLMNGAGLLSASTVGTEPAGWRLVATGDLNGDGHADMLFRHTSGAVGVWFLGNGVFLSAATIASVTNDWHVVGLADLNGDGNADIIWRNDSGAVGAWLMSGATILSANTIGAVVNQWRLAGVGDVNGDGKTDFLWRHDSGTVGVWLMDGFSIATAANIGAATSDWRIVGTGDLNGDGRSDILWRNDTGTVGVWFLNGASLLSANSIANVGNDWHVVAAGDLNADGRADILWRHDSGTVGAWLMNGVSILSAANAGSAASDWHIVGGEQDRWPAPIAPGPC